jgi:hypothetical protein
MSSLQCNITLAVLSAVNVEVGAPLSVNVGLNAVGVPGVVGAALLVLTGEKKTGVEAGVYPSISITDDYLYVCVTGGVAGVAIWKKSLMFQT